MSKKNFPENLEAMFEERRVLPQRYKINRKDARDAGLPTCWQNIACAWKEVAGSSYSRKTQKRKFLD